MENESDHLKQIEQYFRSLAEELGPRTLEVIEDEWEGISYKIKHTDGKHSPWHLRFSGIELPKYDNYRDGPHNNTVRMLFTHLLAKELDWKKSVPPGDFSGEDSVNSTNTAQIPGIVVDDMEHGHDLARRTITSYLGYKDRIELAIGEIESIYRIDSETLESEEWGIENSYNKVHEYPNPEELIPVFREQFGLDYLRDRML